jgi:hypothetical protein
MALMLGCSSGRIEHMPTQEIRQSELTKIPQHYEFTLGNVDFKRVFIRIRWGIWCCRFNWWSSQWPLSVAFRQLQRTNFYSNELAFLRLLLKR